MSKSLTQLSVRELHEGLREKQFSSLELVDAFIQQIKKHDKLINAFISNDFNYCSKMAKQADKQLADKQAQILTGIPIALKDIYCLEGGKTTCGSRMLQDFVAPYNATVTQRLLDDCVPILGKANMDEFAMGSTTKTSYFGMTSNPWDTKAIPGGSSGGPAAAVAARMAPVAIGTDTGGSIRQPAACCGITGIKPTYGAVSRWGQIAFASSLDQGGALAASAEDCAFVLDTIMGFDEKDSTSINQPPCKTLQSLQQAPQKGVIGIPFELFEHDLDAISTSAFKAAIKEYEKLGYTFERISLETAKVAVAAYYIIASAEASSNLSRYDGVRYGYRCENPVDLEDLYKRSRSEGFGEEVKRRLMVGTYVLSSGYYDAYYLQAQKVRNLITKEFKNLFEQYQAIAMPAKPGVAFNLDESLDNPIKIYMEDVFTIPVNLAGLPALSHPIGFNEQNRPFGLQLIGNYHQEAEILQIAHQFQQATDYHQQIPAQFV